MSSVEDRNPSQRQIAAALGISVSTVSRALGDLPGISDELRQRVVRTAQDLGYGRQPRSQPQAPRTRETLDAAGWRVALFVALDTFPSDAAGFYHEILKGAEDELRGRGADLDMVFLQDTAHEADYVAGYCQEHPGCGLLLVALDHPGLIAAGLAAGSQAVIVNGFDPLMRVDGIVPANDRGAQLAVRHLLDLGHRRILTVSAHPRPTLQERHRHFRLALDAAGAADEPGLLIELPRPHPDLAHTAMQARLAGGPLDFTAIICGNDLIAVGVLRALAEKDVEVPGQCSVIGFDDTPIAALSRPRLTTVRIDRAAIGRLGARRLLERMADPDVTPMDIHLGCRLVVRDSTGPAPSATGQQG
jgi:DNA-binding LacI/PurR family transcriptional regulator